MSEQQSGLGGALFGAPVAGATGARSALTAAPPMADLDLIQQESESQELPSQEKQFRVAAPGKGKLHNLPDPTRLPAPAQPSLSLGRRRSRANTLERTSHHLPGTKR